MDEEAFFYYKRLEEEKKMETSHDITEIDQFLSLEEQFDFLK